MKISYRYRGERKEICGDFTLPKMSVNGAVVFDRQGWSDGQQKMYKVTIEADDLLKTAKACLQQLSEISGVQYDIAVTVGGSTNWLERTK